MNHLKLEPVYLNTDLSDKTFDYLKAQKYLKYKNIDKFIKNKFLNDYPFGFIILDKNLNIFGFLGTMFSSRFKGDNDYIFCNLHTWIIDEEKRLTFFSQGKNILNPIFDYKCSFFAKPVNALVRLFLRYYKMEVIEMKYRVSFLLKPSNLFAEQKFKIIDDEETLIKKLSHDNIKIYNDHKNMNCYKFLVCDKKNEDNYIFVIALKKRKKFVFNVLELIYVSNTETFKDNWKNLIFNVCKKFKILFCSQNYIKIEECCIPEKEKIFKDVEDQIVTKNLPKNFKFNTLYSEFVY